MKQVTYKRLLVTHDGSRMASSVLPHAVAVAAAFNAEVLLLQVIESIYPNIAYTPLTPYAGSFSSEEAYERVAELEKTYAVKNLDNLKKELESSGLVNISTKSVEGNAGDEIIKTARRMKSDLIVMATHGRSGLGRVLMGSVAEYVVRNASCPVLLVRSKGS